MNYMLAWPHPGLADVMLSGIIKIFSVSQGGNVTGSGFKRFMPPMLKCLSLHPEPELRHVSEACLQCGL